MYSTSSSLPLTQLNINNKNISTPTLNKLPPIKSLLSLPTPTEPNPSLFINSDSKTQSNTHNIDNLTNKLKIRLQWAYYKFKTNQAELSFLDIKSNILHNKKNNTNTKIIKKKRKLLVSHGNYMKTPSKKNRKEQLINNSSSISTINNILHSSSKLFNLNNTIETTLSDSSITNKLSNNKFINLKNQLLSNAATTNTQTPVKLQAAQSLLHLFSSTKN